jgi:acylphosphatase
MARKRVGVQFFGRVQGVGFRWRCKMIAAETDLTGFAFNESDGTVKAEFQGEESHINKLLYELDHDRFIRIEHMDIRIMPLKENESGFQVW